MSHWTVSTPVYTHHYGYDEPPEDVLDYACVEAPSRRVALTLGLRELRKMRSDWLMDPMTNPFAGLTAERSECHHGNCWCDICTAREGWSECQQCMDEWEAEETSEQVAA